MADSSSTTRIFLLKSGLLATATRGGFTSCVTFIRLYYRTVIQRAVPHSGAISVELVGQPRCRHRVLQDARRIERGRKVFAQEIERESTLERAGRPRLRQPLVEQVVRSRSGGEHVADGPQVGAGFS